MADAQQPSQKWSNPVEFLLSCVAMSVGIGNFYRFPYVCYKNGGGAFLIPYLIVLLIIGKPLYFLELGLGQFSSRSQVGVWNCVPALRGIGYASALASFCVVTYYVSVMSLCVFYVFSSFSSELPWGRGNMTAEEFFFNHTLHQRPSISTGIGYPDWKLSLCYLLSWMCVCFSIIKGVASSGKVAYFTAIYPYVVLCVMFVTGATREGAVDGMSFFVRADWGKLLEAEVWFAAVSQCFFSLSVGFGPIILYASFNDFKHNVYRDAMIVSVIDTLTSFFAGLTVFSILGNLSKETGISIEKVAKSGPSLVFVSYADAIAKFEYVPQLFSVLFFLMLFTLGVGSAVSWQLAVVTVIQELFPKIKKTHITVVLCTICFFIGLVYCTPGGQQLLTLTDFFTGNFVIFILATLETVGFIYIYGLHRVVLDFEEMLGFQVGFYWRWTWRSIPLFLFIIFVYSVATLERVEYEGVWLPWWAVGVGWGLAGTCLAFVPLVFLGEVWRGKKKGEGLLERVKLTFKPNKSWGI